MIYFDKNKQAYAFEIENSIAAIDDETWKKHAGKDNWDIVDGVFVDISDTQKYKDKIAQEQKTATIVELQKQIDELDLKCIRAMRDGGVKDETSGQTWLEFYTVQILALRTQMTSL